ncbi:MAG: cell division topological specificity factor MinE [Myxococcota bacterium]
MSLFDRLFSGKSSQSAGSKEDAKSRLKILLVHDQVDLTPSQMNAMKAEILEVIARYCEVDREHVDVRLEKADNGISVVSSVPVRRVTSRTAEAT